MSGACAVCGSCVGERERKMKMLPCLVVPSKSRGGGVDRDNPDRGEWSFLFQTYVSRKINCTLHHHFFDVHGPVCNVHFVCDGTFAVLVWDG